jgi:hypothetical protein
MKQTGGTIFFKSEDGGVDCNNEKQLQEEIQNYPFF